MERETGVLQKRVQILTVERRRFEPQERVGCEQDEGEKRHCDRGLHRQHPGAQGRRQAFAKPGRHRAEQCQDQHPKQQRAFVIPPNPSDLVDHRFQGVGVVDHQTEREIRGHKGIGQRPETDRGQHELRRCGGIGHRHPARSALGGANHRHDHLEDGHHKGQDEGEMSEFYDHVSILCCRGAMRQ